MSESISSLDKYKKIKEIRHIISNQGINNPPEVSHIVQRVLQKIDSGEQLESAALKAISSHIRGCSR
ncbi:hypothetical protein [Mastigocoleus sp. MO_188.B34]|uniref:hypothetical protein n=1 Tax=Mastigocoleus sp. MO_188.B34 TaxID=3036635 RepID=UPI002638DA52|nr:hypothetical protein [Mastigocoleus sp. MO_188.B34]MDJ0693187.1 hypothetical protein [Mastigocoleus sp. MO_188.B34]